MPDVCDAEQRRQGDPGVKKREVHNFFGTATDSGIILAVEFKATAPEQETMEAERIVEILSTIAKPIPFPYDAVFTLPPPTELNLVTHPVLFVGLSNNAALKLHSFQALKISDSKSFFYMRTLDGIQKAMELALTPVVDSLVLHFLVHHSNMSFYVVEPLGHPSAVVDLLKKADPKALFGSFYTSPSAKSFVMIVNPGPLAEYLAKETVGSKHARSPVLPATISRFDTDGVLQRKREKLQKKLNKKGTKRDELADLLFPKAK